MSIKRIVITAGEPSGVGPDLVLALAQQSWSHQIIVCGDKSVLKERAQLLGLTISFIDYDNTLPPHHTEAGTLVVDHISVQTKVVPGCLDEKNSQYVLKTLERAAKGCMSGEFDAIVTGPVHKGIINKSGVDFSGHTEFFAEQSNTPTVVMMLATEGLRVALVTTHIPLAQVSDAVTEAKIEKVVKILHKDLIEKFAIVSPKIYVCGLNPHAGEDGCLGMEEINTITPTLDKLRSVDDMDIIGPLPADTIFNSKYLDDADAILGMYHDQVLPVLKYKGFGRSVNITLGLPFIRTSVDHGTALDLVGTGKADQGSLKTALSYAIEMAEKH